MFVALPENRYSSSRNALRVDLFEADDARFILFSKSDGRTPSVSGRSDRCIAAGFIQPEDRAIQGDGRREKIGVAQMDRLVVAG